MINDVHCYPLAVSIIHGIKAFPQRRITKEEIPVILEERDFSFQWLKDAIKQIHLQYTLPDDGGKRTIIRRDMQNTALRSHPAIGLVIIHAVKVQSLLSQLESLDVGRDLVEKRLIAEYDSLCQTAKTAEIF